MAFALALAMGPTIAVIPAEWRDFAASRAASGSVAVSAATSSSLQPWPVAARRSLKSETASSAEADTAEPPSARSPVCGTRCPAFTAPDRPGPAGTPQPRSLSVLAVSGATHAIEPSEFLTTGTVPADPWQYGLCASYGPERDHSPPPDLHTPYTTGEERSPAPSSSMSPSAPERASAAAGIRSRASPPASRAAPATNTESYAE